MLSHACAERQNALPPCVQPTEQGRAGSSEGRLHVSSATGTPLRGTASRPSQAFTSDVNETSLLLSLLRTARPVATDAGAHAALSARGRLHFAIHRMATAQPPQRFLGRFIVTEEHAEGGQAVVHYARGGATGFFQYAIKCAPPRPRAPPPHLTPASVLRSGPRAPPFHAPLARGRVVLVCSPLFYDLVSLCAYLARRARLRGDSRRRASQVLRPGAGL